MNRFPKTTKEFQTFIKALSTTPVDPYQTVRDTTDAMAGKYMAELNSVIEKHKTLEEPYYIVAYTRRSFPSEKILHTTFVARRTLPIPDWKTTAYKVNNRENRITLVWSLPSDADGRQIVKRPDLFDSKLVEDCALMLSGKELPDNSFRHIEVDL